MCNVICLESQTAPRGDQTQHWVSVPNIYHEFYISFNVHNISGKRCTFHLQFLFKKSYHKRECMNIKRL